MIHISPAGCMIGLDVLMIVYTLWILSGSVASKAFRMVVGVTMVAWLALLHFGLSNEALFPRDIGGIGFLIVIVAGVLLVGGLIMIVSPVRKILFNLDQDQLLLLQGIRVFFGATFLIQASQNVLPPMFGIIDGITHISAGFFGLIAAYAIVVGRNGVRRAWFANIFGLADILIVASTLALILLPQIGPHHAMMYAVFLPAPLWLWFHIVSMIKLIYPSTATTRA